METDALAIANYFVRKGLSDTTGEKLTLLRLVKYVYIAYGFALALINKSIINDRFDKVEAWKYGPVIPSVYHSFKHFKNNPIDKETEILKQETLSGELCFETPEVSDEIVKSILDFVWERYKGISTTELINLLHKEGTPWKFCYEEGWNAEIPCEMTKLYYDGLVKALARN